MSGVIFIKGLRIQAGHRPLDREVEPIDQRLVVDLELSLALANASYSDRLEDTANYSDVVATAATAFAESDHLSLEAAAGSLADAILSAHYRVDAVTVTLHVPMSAIFEDTGISVFRYRHRDL